MIHIMASVTAYGASVKICNFYLKNFFATEISIPILLFGDQIFVHYKRCGVNIVLC